MLMVMTSSSRQLFLTALKTATIQSQKNNNNNHSTSLRMRRCHLSILLSILGMQQPGCRAFVTTTSISSTASLTTTTTTTSSTAGTSISPNFFGISVLEGISSELETKRKFSGTRFGIEKNRYQRNQFALYSSTSSAQRNSNSNSWAENDDDYDDEEEEEDDDDDNDDTLEDEDSPLFEEYERWSNALNHAIETLQKKRNSLESELEKAKGVEDTVARAQLLVSNLYMFTPGVKSAMVQDWENDGKEIELKLNPKYDTASAEADALFAQARKLKRGSKVVKDLLEETAEAWDILQEAKVDLESALLQEGNDSDDEYSNVDDDEEEESSSSSTPIIDQGRLLLVQDRLIRTSRLTNFQPPSDEPKSDKKPSQNKRQSKPEIGTPASNIRKLISPGGCIVLVGRNRRGNEHLSLSIARGNDIWMHSRGCPGAHVLIQNRRGSPKPTDECLQFAADLAIFYSDLRNEAKAEVTAAEPKHIQKPRGAPLGAIKLREEWKTFVGRPDMVPDELKEARDKSGQSDEYRSVDKAKHRRRTKQAAEEDRAKRKKKNR